MITAFAVRKFRKRIDISQAQLARLMRVTQPAISKWEEGGIPDGPASAFFQVLALKSTEELQEFFHVTQKTHRGRKPHDR